MTDPARDPAAPARPEHGETLRRLEKIVRHYRGFRLVLALYNDPPDYRDRLIAHLDGMVSRPGLIDARSCPDFAEFERRLAQAAMESELIHVTGLDAWLREDAGLARMQGFNLRRETLAAECGNPLLLWLPVHLAAAFATLAPDFWEWRQALLDFSVAREALPEWLETSLRRIATGRALNLPAETETAGAPPEDWSHARFNLEHSRVEQALESGRRDAALAAATRLYRWALAAGEAAYPEADYDLALAAFLLGRALNRAGAASSALPLLEEAQQRFERFEHRKPGKTVERMVMMSLGEQSESLIFLGRYDEAAAVCEEAIRRAEDLGDSRQVGAGKGNLGTIYLEQKRYPEALVAFSETRDNFAALGDNSSVATAWHQIGRVHEHTGRYDEAERAYRESLGIALQLGDIAGQANTLNQMGILFRRLGRLEDAAESCRKAAHLHLAIGDRAGEGTARNNLAIALLELRRTAEARNEINRAIELKVRYGHATRIWTSWSLLGAIESADGHAEAAAEARGKALAAFLAYRRDGGENRTGSGRLCFAVGELLVEGRVGEAVGLLHKWRINPDLPAEALPLLDALDAIIAGRRDPTLAEDPALSYDQAAEIILLLERLTRPEPSGG